MLGTLYLRRFKNCKGKEKESVIAALISFLLDVDCNFPTIFQYLIYFFMIIQSLIIGITAKEPLRARRRLRMKREVKMSWLDYSLQSFISSLNYMK